MKKKNLIVVLAVLLLCVAAAGVTNWRQKSPEEIFPIWELAEELEPTQWSNRIRDGGELVSLETVTAGDMAWDELRLLVSSDGEYEAFLYDLSPCYVDYKFRDVWYNICQEGHPQGTSVPGTPTEIALRLPSGLFRMQGEYRVRFTDGDWGELGRCQFTIRTPTRPVEGMAENNFDIWRPVDEQSRGINENVSFTFHKLEPSRDPKCAELTMGLTCSTESYSYCGDCWNVDYLYDGEWYCVGSNRFCLLMGWEDTAVPGLEYIKERSVPAQVLEHPGTYRYYWKDLGYCFFDVA